MNRDRPVSPEKSSRVKTFSTNLIENFKKIRGKLFFFKKGLRNLGPSSVTSLQFA